MNIVQTNVNEMDNETLEALQAIEALASHHCYHCRKPLRPERNYICCGVYHCPICKKSTHDPGGRCEHTIARKPSQQVIVLQAVGHVISPNPARSRKQTVGKSAWSEAQMRAAYGDIYPVAVELYGPNGTEIRWCDTVKAVLLGHIKIEYLMAPKRYPNRTRYWFDRDPARVQQDMNDLLAKLRAGTLKLRKMRPEGSVPAKGETSVTEAEFHNGCV